jgi:hypothetical protein
MNKTIGLIMALMLITIAAASDPLGLNLPTTPVTMNIAHPGAVSYWSVTFSGIGDGYDISNGNYPGWCADADTQIGQGTHQTRLYSAYDTALPAQAQSQNWDKITYMVNRYRDNAYPCANKYVIQNLVWYYVGDTYDWGSVNATCRTLVKNDVEANGDGFTPAAGDIAPVVCYTVEGTSAPVLRQLIFVETKYVPTPEAILAVAAIALLTPGLIYFVRKRRE